MSHWEPKTQEKDPVFIHQKCGGVAQWVEPHYILYPEPDWCCSYMQCLKCGDESPQCRGEYKEASN